MLIQTSDGSNIYIHRMQNYRSVEHGRHVNKEKYVQEDLDIHAQRMFRESDWIVRRNMPWKSTADASTRKT